MSRTSPMLLVLLISAASVPAAGQERSAASLEALPAAQWDAQAASHLLWRAGFGGARGGGGGPGTRRAGRAAQKARPPCR